MAMLRGLRECAKLKGIRFVHVGSFGQEPNWFAQPLPSRISEACRRAFVTAFAKVRKEFDLLLGHSPVVSLTAEKSGAGPLGHSPGRLEAVSPQSEERD
jgi:hypothetical protein